MGREPSLSGREAPIAAGGTVTMGFFAQISGWTRLADAYPAEGPLEGQPLSKQTVQVGSVRFRRCVTAGVSGHGLYLWARPMFSAYRPVLIPWAELRSMGTARIYWSKAALLAVGSPQVATIRVRGSLLRLIKPYLESGVIHPE